VTEIVSRTILPNYSIPDGYIVVPEPLPETITVFDVAGDVVAVGEIVRREDGSIDIEWEEGDGE